MQTRVACSLTKALDLSPDWGALLQTETLWVRVIPRLGWQVTIGVGGGMMYEVCGKREACIQFLQNNGYPLDTGWLPDLPTATQPDEEVSLDYARLH